MATYTDDIKVKISEKYKPPPRINLITSYAQRINLNKQVQNNIPNYDFSMDKYVLQKMREWKESKSLAIKERQSNLELKRQRLEAKREEDAKNVKANNNDDESQSPSNYDTSTNENLTNDVSQDMNYRITNNPMLIPTQVSNCYSNILKPIQNYGKQMVNMDNVKTSSFNLSDFEDDTSSPFDNMELKSINDLEELAQVLNKEDKDHKGINKVYPQNCQTGNSYSTHLNYNDYLSNSYSGNQYLAHIPSTLPSARPNNENFIYSNGYKYQTEYSQFNQQYHTPYTWAKLSSEYPFQLSDIGVKKSNCKSVPDIVNALERELESTHIADPSYSRSDKMKANVDDSRPKSSDNASVIHSRSQDEIDLVKSLTKDEQNLCKAISVMGFPFERVARVSKLLGSDEKKIVEHLLAMSVLLDLGFKEKDVSIALLECDNDRDKALDKLIT